MQMLQRKAKLLFVAILASSVLAGCQKSNDTVNSMAGNSATESSSEKEEADLAAAGALQQSRSGEDEVLKDQELFEFKSAITNAIDESIQEDIQKAVEAEISKTEKINK